MDEYTKELLAKSLTARSTELIPYLPYLLSDFWALGSDPDVIVDLIESYIAKPADLQMLDLGCGKGAVAVQLACRTGAKVTGVDILPEFVEYARDKAREYGVEHLCQFQVEDITQPRARRYDCVIYGAVGGVLGNAAATLDTLLAMVRPHGYVIIDDAYAWEDGGPVRFESDEYPTWDDWMGLFKNAGVRMLGAAETDEEEAASRGEEEIAHIKARATELQQKHPEKTALFQGYVQSQQDEYDDLRDTVAGITWMLQKGEL